MHHTCEPRPPILLLPALSRSWDRQPYQADPAQPNNLYPRASNISRNLFISNYHSTWCVSFALPRRRQDVLRAFCTSNNWPAAPLATALPRRSQAHRP